MSNNKAIVEEVITNKKSRDFPILLHFQNGNLKEDTSAVDFTLAQDSETKEKKAVAAVNNNIYHGLVNGQKSNEVVNTFIAIRNRETQKVRLIQVKQATLQNSIYDSKPTQGDSIMDAEVAKKLMLKNFGGRRANRSLEMGIRMNVNMNNVTDALDNAVEITKVADEQPGEYALSEENLSGIRPNFNKEAKTIREVYSLYDVVPKNLMDRLNDEADAVLDTNSSDLPITSALAKERIQNIKISADPRSEENYENIKALIYLDALRNVTRMHFGQSNMDKASFSQITEKVENDIRKRFSQPGLSSLKRTTYTKDKAICHYIVLALLTSPKYETDINVLVEEMAISKTTVLKFANLVSAKPKAKEGVLALSMPDKTMQLVQKTFKRKRQ